MRSELPLLRGRLLLAMGLVPATLTACGAGGVENPGTEDTAEGSETGQTETDAVAAFANRGFAIESETHLNESGTRFLSLCRAKVTP